MMSAAEATISVKDGKLHVQPDPIVVYRMVNTKAKMFNRIKWITKGASGDIFLVVIQSDGPFEVGGNVLKEGVYARVGPGAIQTKKLKKKVRNEYKYTIIRVRGTDVLSLDPRISVQG